MSNSSHPLRVGVLLISPLQLLDASPVDLFSMLSKSYLTSCGLPAPLVKLGLEVEINYIAESGPDTIAECTANAGLRVTASLDDKLVAPGNLDVLLIPGPDPSLLPSERVKAFIKSHVGPAQAVMTVCTGVFPAAYSGILKGRTMTGPRSLIPKLRKEFPETIWVEQRWVRDGTVWCSGGITNGLEMVAAYIRETWPGPLAETVVAMADVGERRVEYGSRTSTENAWWLWQILRAWRVGLWK